MLELIPKTNFDFVGKRTIGFILSGTILISGIVSLVLKGGPKMGLDFTGGSLVEVKFQKSPSLQEIRNALDQKGVSSFELQSIPNQSVFIIRTQLPKEALAAAAADKGSAASDDMSKKILTILEQTFPDQKPVVLRKEFVGPTVGKHLFKDTAFAFILTFVGIIAYVGYRFRSGVWGTAGVIALVHDVFSTIGVFSILNKEISVTVVAALLTIAGYSINDTIVIYDFMREKMRLLRSESLYNVINISINTTLSRTIITSLTVFIIALALFFFGGEVIHDFAFAMVFGVAIGTYSSIAVAAPIIYEWVDWKARKK